jgi:hypothetical protein
MFALRCWSSKAKDDLPLVLGRVFALAPSALRVDDSEANHAAKRPSDDRVPGLVVGGGVAAHRHR